MSKPKITDAGDRLERLTKTLRVATDNPDKVTLIPGLLYREMRAIGDLLAASRKEPTTETDAYAAILSLKQRIKLEIRLTKLRMATARSQMRV